MTPDPQELRIQEIFADAVALPSDAQPAFLDRACEGEPTLRAKIDVLLAAHRRAGDFLAEPAAAAITIPTEADMTGTRIGRYKLLETIGEGGFGTVYLAEQETPIHRKVALKIIKLGMDTKQVIARFEAERQALAILDHPHIAKVYDAGATETGRPFFVMELVNGVSITHYCDEHNLSPRQRLEMFIPVCQAVHHAHQKGIIHRDLKPNNVLVTVQDDRAIPKVIDFGIAKATQSRLTERTLFTELRQLIGTPAYMSPEQAGITTDIADIDTRSDIYSLGVLLYELLTGTTPIEEKTLRAAAYDQMQKMIREYDPPKPSTRLSTMGETIASVAALRNVEPRALSRTVQGEIDWIVMKCLEKDRIHRYESAGALAADLSRHLSGDIVEAGPPSGLYRTRKFVRRHRVAIGVSTLLLGCIIGALVVSLVSLSRVERARRLAEAANQNATDVSNYTLQVYADKKGEKFVRDAYDRLREAYGPDHPNSIIAQRNLGDWLVNHKDFAAGEALLRDSLPRARRVFGPASEETASNVAQLAMCLHHQGRFEEALPLSRELHKIAFTPGFRPDLQVTFCTWLGGDLTVLHRYAEARQPLLDAEQLLRSKDVISWSRRGVMLNLAEGYEAEGNDGEAKAWRRRAAEFSSRFTSTPPSSGPATRETL